MTDDVRAWLERTLGTPLTTCVRLTGSTSSTLYTVNDSYVVRVLDREAWLAEEPDLAEHELAALTEAQKSGVPVPAPIASADQESGFGVPTVLMSLLPGEVFLPKIPTDHWIATLAETLAKIHKYIPHDFGWHYTSWVDPKTLATPEWAQDSALWERAIALWNGPPPQSPFVFLHRDFHPVNTLWKDAKLTGVVDWITACRGPAGVDVGHCRINLALMYGPSTATKFLSAYQEAAPRFVYEPYWDLDTLLDSCMPTPTFYEPWATFGLARLPTTTLCTRLEDYLGSIFAEPLR